MSEQFHTLTITTDGKPERCRSFGGYKRIEMPGYEVAITCIPGGCHGWQECQEEHAVDGVSAADGPDDCDEGAPWADEEEFEFHGQVHTWRHGWGWTVEYPGCVLAAQDSIHDWAHDILADYGPGAYLVDDDWGDDYLDSLTATSLADGSPLPEPGWIEREAIQEADHA